MRQYRERLPDIFEKMKEELNEELEKLYHLLNEIALEFEMSISRSLSNCHTLAFEQDEKPQVTGDLKFKEEIVVEPIIESFMNELREYLSVTHTMIEPKLPEDNREYVWSLYSAADYNVTNNGKTITKTSQNSWRNIAMDRPMEHGRHVWKLKIESSSANFYVGVCAQPNRFD